MELFRQKNRDYALGGPRFGNFERVAAILANYPGLDLSKMTTVAYVYMLKHLDAVLWSLSHGHHMAEGIEKRQADITVYSAIIEDMFRE